MTDIVQQLRALAANDPHADPAWAEAAATEIERLREVLQRIASLETKWFPSKKELLMEIIQEAKKLGVAKEEQP